MDIHLGVVDAGADRYGFVSAIVFCEQGVPAMPNAIEQARQGLTMGRIR